jgi:hypothetical protein
MGSEVPREQVGDAVDGVCWDLGKHCSEIQLWVESIELGRAYEGVERGGAVSAGVRSGEEVILPSQRDSAQGSLG